jgi:hypothetical protein
MTRKEEYQERKQKLCQLTAEYRELRQSKIDKAKTLAEAMRWTNRTINSFIVEHYQEQFKTGEFNTFLQWKEKGKTIKKGEKGFPIWGQPLGHRAEEKEKNGEPDPNDYKYFPICYIFHESQTFVKE